MGDLFKATLCCAIPLLLLQTVSSQNSTDTSAKADYGAAQDKVEPSENLGSIEIPEPFLAQSEIEEVKWDMLRENPLAAAAIRIRQAKDAQTVEDMLEIALITNLGPILQSTTDKMRDFVCRAAQQLQKNLESTVSLAKAVTHPEDHPKFLDMLNPPAEDNTEFETAMRKLTRYMTENSFLIDINAVNQAVNEAIYVQSLKGRKAIASAKLWAANGQLKYQLDKIVYGAKYGVSSTYIGWKSLEIIKDQLESTKLYPENMEAEEKKIRMGLAVSYRLDCPNWTDTTHDWTL